MRSEENRAKERRVELEVDGRVAERDEMCKVARKGV